MLSPTKEAGHEHRVRFSPVSLTAEKYDEAVQRVNDELGPPDGCEYHVCFGESGSLKVSELWDSREQWEAFVEKLMPILEAVGVNAGQPDVYEVHHIERRDGASA